jgi:hypothetical protein
MLALVYVSGATRTVAPMDLSELPGYDEAWRRLVSRLRNFLNLFGDQSDALMISFAGVVQRGDEWKPEWDFQNGPWVQLDVDAAGRVRTSCGSNQFLAEPFRLSSREIDQMVGLGFAEPVATSPQNPDEFSWNQYFLRYDERGQDCSIRLADAIIAAFRSPFRAPHPSLLEYMAWGPCVAAAETLGLSPSDLVKPE